MKCPSKSGIQQWARSAKACGPFICLQHQAPGVFTRGSEHLKHWSSIYPDELEQLATQQADILITHEAPGYHEHGFKELDSLARRIGVPMMVHGHQHDNIDSSARWAEQGFESYGVGLRGVMALDGLD